MNMIFTIFAFILFGALVLFHKNLVVNSVTLAAQNEMSLAAIAAGQSVIDEAKTKAFDNNTRGGVSVSDSSGLSSTMGPDSTSEYGGSVPSLDTLSLAGFKSSTNFDDVDDYNGYTRLVKLSPSGGDVASLSVRVEYVESANPDLTVASGKSYCKRMTVTIANKYLPGNYALSYVFTY